MLEDELISIIHGAICGNAEHDKSEAHLCRMVTTRIIAGMGNVTLVPRAKWNEIKSILGGAGYGRLVDEHLP